MQPAASPADTARVTPMRPVADLTARRAARDSALTASAEGRVVHVTREFLDALNCRGEWAPEPRADEVPRRHLFAV